MNLGVDEDKGRLATLASLHDAIQLGQGARLKSTLDVIVQGQTLFVGVSSKQIVDGEALVHGQLDRVSRTTTLGSRGGLGDGGGSGGGLDVDGGSGVLHSMYVFVVV